MKKLSKPPTRKQHEQRMIWQALGAIESFRSNARTLYIKGCISMGSCYELESWCDFTTFSLRHRIKNL